jgi:hypothetical protein
MFASDENDLGMAHENGDNEVLETREYQANAAEMPNMTDLLMLFRCSASSAM